MKDFFNRRQRFSLRKYSIGVCSVLLGTALFAAHGAQADELASTDTPVTPEASVTGDDSSSLVTTSTTATQQTDPTSVVSASAETSASATLDLTPSVTTSADASTGETAKTQAETAKESDESVSESSVENHSDKVMTLTTALPVDADLEEAMDDGHYLLTKSSGFAFSHATNENYRKQDLYKFASGSTFSKTFEGQIVDVRPLDFPHAVLNYAKPLFYKLEV